MRFHWDAKRTRLVKRHTRPLADPCEKTFLVLGGPTQSRNATPGNDFSSDRDAKEHRNALRNNHAQDIHEHRTVFAFASCVASPYQQHRNKSCRTNKDQTLTETFFVLKEDPQ